jgi:hypothetical protein
MDLSRDFLSTSTCRRQLLISAGGLIAADSERKYIVTPKAPSVTTVLMRRELEQYI